MRQRRNRGGYLSLRFVVIVAAGLASLGCEWILNRPFDNAPRVFVGEDARSWARAIDRKYHISLDAMAFYHGDLYVGSNAGLFKIGPDRRIELLKWRRYDDVITGTIRDNVNDSIWVYDNRLAQFYRKSSEGWATVALPNKEWTRGDLMAGFTGSSSGKAFLLQGANDAWSWNPSTAGWEAVELPDFECRFGSAARDCFASIVSTKTNTFYVMHSEFTLGGTDLARSLANSMAPRPEPDRVFYRSSGTWHEVMPTGDLDFVLVNFVSTDSRIFALGAFGIVYQFDEGGIERIEPPGKIDAMVGTTAGTLLVSVKGKGIYEYDGEWHKRFECPYPPEPAVLQAYLAEENGKVAFVINTGDQKSMDITGSRLWLSEGAELVELPIL